jgi:type I restriction enzyme, S subunit
VPDLGLREIGRFPIQLPPMQEQAAIADFLESEVGKISELITEAQRAVALLHERQTALISAAVTGKIDVCG